MKQRTKAVQAEAKPGSKDGSQGTGNDGVCRPDNSGSGNTQSVLQQRTAGRIENRNGERPAIYNLVVPISNLAAVNADIASQSGAAYVFYKKAAEYKA